MRGAGNRGDEIPYLSLHLRSSLATSSRSRLLNSLLIALNRAQIEIRKACGGGRFSGRFQETAILYEINKKFKIFALS